MHGRAVVLFTAQNTAAITDLDSPLVIHQDVIAEPGYTANPKYLYRYGRCCTKLQHQMTLVLYCFVPTTSAIGCLTLDLVEISQLRYSEDLAADAQILGKNSDTIVFDEAAPTYSFIGSRNFGLFYVDTHSTKI